MIITIRKQTGFTLVEALVALVIMAVGMLGIAGLYVEGLRAGRTAIYRTNAVVLAADMADRIRTNPGPSLYDARTGAGTDEISTVGCVAGCDPQELADQDWQAWLSDIGRRLPQGSSAEITAVDNAAAPDLYTITIRWPESGQDTDVTYTMAFQR